MGFGRPEQQRPCIQKKGEDRQLSRAISPRGPEIPASQGAFQLLTLSIPTEESSSLLPRAVNG